MINKTKNYSHQERCVAPQTKYVASALAPQMRAVVAKVKCKLSAGQKKKKICDNKTAINRCS